MDPPGIETDIETGIESGGEAGSETRRGVPRAPFSP